MARYSVFLALIVLTIALFGLTAPISQAATADASSSVNNQVPDFYAEGTSADYSVKLSPKGGYVSSSAGKINFMPWGYVTTQWTIGNVYIIFLANVTASDFYIGFLYLTNSSSPFILRIFEYAGANTREVTFDGMQYVYARMASAPSTIIPQITFAPKAQSTNSLSAMGPEIYVNGNTGQVVNGTQILNLYPLTDQLYSGPTDYNELWSLLTDNAGEYIFAILYFQNSNHNRVIMEHQLRLNDYSKIDGRGFDAQWQSETFATRITVKTPIPSAIVKIDGFPFNSDKSGILSVYVPSSWVTIEVPNEVNLTSDTILRFSSWKGQGTANPLNVTFGSAPTSYTAEYMTQNQLTITSEYGNVQGAGWYDQGSNASFSAASAIDLSNDTRGLFDNWSGDYSSPQTSGTLLMDSPKTISANWKTQYAVKWQFSGLPSNLTSQASIVVNGQPLSVNASSANLLWMDANTQLSVEVQSPQIQAPTHVYNFTTLEVNGQPSGPSFVVSRPTTVTIMFSDQPKIQSAIALSANPSSSIQGYPVMITGTLSPAASSDVALFYSTNGFNWRPLANVTTGGDGKFSYAWSPQTSGDFYVRATWLGDPVHAPSFNTVAVKVQGLTLPGYDPSSNLIQDLTSSLKTVPFLSTLIGLAHVLLLLGVAIAALVYPTAPAYVGYFFGSILVGFVFIFPISAIILSVKAARSHRSPRAIWLTPLAVIWIGALGVLTLGGGLFSLEPLVVPASTILLIASNTLLIPLAVSVSLAKAVAS